MQVVFIEYIMQSAEIEKNENPLSVACDAQQMQISLFLFHLSLKYDISSWNFDDFWLQWFLIKTRKIAASTIPNNNNKLSWTIYDGTYISRDKKQLWNHWLQLLLCNNIG